MFDVDYESQTKNQNSRRFYVKIISQAIKEIEREITPENLKPI